MRNKKRLKKLVAKIAKNIKKIRRQKGFTQEDMAEKGFNYKYYQKIENGKYSSSIATLLRIAESLNVELIIEFKNNKKR